MFSFYRYQNQRSSQYVCVTLKLPHLKVIFKENVSVIMISLLGIKQGSTSYCNSMNLLKRFYKTVPVSKLHVYLFSSENMFAWHALNCY